MKTQTENLVKEWNGVVGDMLNADAVLKNNTRQVAEAFDGTTYSRIHIKTNGSLYVEERKKGSMYPTVWKLKQDFTEMENELKRRTENANQ